jgi:rRNA biogenesis protein RRP5
MKFIHACYVAKVKPCEVPVQEAEPGSRAHGYVTGVQDYGVFIAFCGGVKGLAPASQLGLEPNQDPAKHFPLGKVCLSQLLTHHSLHMVDVVDRALKA